MSTITTIFLIFLAQCVYLYSLADTRKWLAEDTCRFTDKAVSMILFTRDYPVGKNIRVEQCCENIDKSKPIAFLIHGFLSYANTSDIRNVANQLVKNDYAVFSLDWSQAVCSKFWPAFSMELYRRAASNIHAVSAYAVSYVQVLIEKCHVSLDQIIFLGHSLGGHVSGLAAKKIKEMGFGTLPLIIAMDPAKLDFSNKTCENRLCKEDANRLVVLHTSEFGLSDPIGHLDLYFNNQTMQPGCHGFREIKSVCSHSRAIVYTGNFIKDNCGFIGVPQKTRAIEVKNPSENDMNCIYLNNKLLDKDDTKEGSYYVFVNSDAPYCTEKSLSCKI